MVPYMIAHRFSLYTSSPLMNQITNAIYDGFLEFLLTQVLETKQQLSELVHERLRLRNEEAIDRKMRENTWWE